MNIQTALSLLGLNEGNHTAKEIKTAYKKASIKFHPDRNPAGLEMMQAINEAWAVLKDLEGAAADGSCQTDLGDALNEALKTVLDLNGLIVELCGSWVWVTGDTKAHKEAIKAAGYKWAKKKVAWYFRPEEAARKSGGKSWNMDKIRNGHGSKMMKGQRSTTRCAISA
tara:strand:+ start:177 stop:680 length:504 start_codon:yes stop_codon:yes gene_type:complete